MIPGNDDAIRSIRLLTRTISDAILEGKAIRDEKLEADMKQASKLGKAAPVEDAEGAEMEPVAKGAKSATAVAEPPQTEEPATAE